MNSLNVIFLILGVSMAALALGKFLSHLIRQQPMEPSDGAFIVSSGLSALWSFALWKVFDQSPWILKAAGTFILIALVLGTLSRIGRR